MKAQPPQVIPPSPVTREFDKYIKYNVSLYNGLPEITIPLYEIKLKALTIPIALSYHASGIKYRQNSGEVGVGWVLNPKYRISKTIYGKDDYNSSMPSPVIDPYSAFNNMSDRDKYLSGFFQNHQFFMPQSNVSYDGEYDIFNYSLQGNSGTFIQTNRQTAQFEFLDSRKIKITHAPTDDQYYFDLIDGNGIKYRIGNNANHLQGPMESYGIMDGFRPTGLGWFATEISTPNSEFIKLEYISRGVVEDQDYLLNAILQEDLGHDDFQSYGTVVSYNKPDHKVYNTSFIKTIITPQEKIEFFHDEAGSLLRKIEVKNPKNELIRRIEFTYTQDGGYTLLSTAAVLPADNSDPMVYTFEYYPKNPSVPSPTFDDWGCLYSNTRYPYAPNSPPNPPTYSLPVQLGYDKVYMDDRFQKIDASNFLSEYKFFDKVVDQDPVDYSLKRITYPTGGYSEYEYESNQCEGYGSLQKLSGLRVKKISSVDGINDSKVLIREYKYGINEAGYGRANLYLDPGDFISENVYNVKGFYVNGMAFGLGMLYSYSNQSNNEAVGDGDSKLFYPEVNEYVKDAKGLILGRTQYLFDAPTDWFFRYSRMSTNGSYIVLPIGTVSEEKNRKYLPRFLKKYSPWATPHLIETNVFGYANNVYSLLKKEKLQYNTIVRNDYLGLKVRLFLSAGNCLYEEFRTASGYNGLLSSVFDYANYNIVSGTILPTKKTTTEYSTAGNLITEQNFYYNENDQLIKEEVSNSKNEIIITEYKFPSDYKNLSAINEVTQGVRKLQELNILNPILESNVYRRNSLLTQSLTSSQFICYNSTNPFPSKILQTENNLSLTDFSPSKVQSGAIILDNRLKEKIVFDEYDDFGNLLQQHRISDVNRSYIWDYNSTLPIAAVTNTSLSDIAYTSFEGEGKGNWNNFTGPITTVTPNSVRSNMPPTGNKYYNVSSTNTLNKSVTVGRVYIISYWRNNTSPYSIIGGTAIPNSYQTGRTVNGWTYHEHKIFATLPTLTISGLGLIDEVRLYPDGAQMTTYTYEPLIGMTSECDASNRIIYYEYDGLGRLKIVRDQDNKIIKQIDYQYEK